MVDVAFVTGTLAFFALAIAYARACQTMSDQRALP